MKIVVTGCAGFIGSHLVRRLVDDGHIVLGVDTVHPKEAWRISDMLGDFTYIWGSTSDFHERDTDIVLHLSSVTDVAFGAQNPRYTLQRNTEDLLGLLEHFWDAKQFIVFSTHSVYGRNQPQPIREDVPLHASNLYGAFKGAQELIALAYYQEKQRPITVVRPSLTYGPTERPGALVSMFLERALRGQIISLNGGGYQSRDCNYVSNLIDGLCILLGKDWAIGKIYNIGSGEVITIRELAEMCCEFAGVDFDSATRELPPRPGEEGKIALDITAISKRGYVPKVGFQEGFLRTAKYVKAQLEGG